MTLELPPVGLNPATVDVRIKLSQLPNISRGLTLNDYRCPPGDPKVLAQVTEYCLNMRSYAKRGVGLFLAGPSGMGKTMLACIVARIAIERYRVLTHFVTHATYMDWVVASVSKPDSIHLPDEIERRYDDFYMYNAYLTGIRRDVFDPDQHRKVGLLVIDDVGKDHVTGSQFAEDKFDSLIRSRYNYGLPTIVTTNLDGAGLSDRYNPSLWSFVHEAYILLHLDNDAGDYRVEPMVVDDRYEG